MSKHRLEYGSLAELFKNFGYDSNEGIWRPYQNLSNIMTTYRKDFTRTVLLKRSTQTPFPADEYRDPDAQLCASSFLKEHINDLFQSPSDSSKTSLTYPHDSDEILTILAKIFVTQEKVYRKNQLWYAQKKAGTAAKAATAHDDNTSVDDEETPGNSLPRRKLKPHTRFLDDDLSTSESDNSMWSPRQKKYHQDKWHKIHLPKNIDINLNATYPPGGSPDGKHSLWLFEPESSWPEDLHPWAFRYMHEHKLYKIQGTSRVLRFVAALKKQVQLRGDLPAEQETQVYNKCAEFIAIWIDTWVKCGLLIHKNDEVYRHPALDKEWQTRRSQWIAMFPGGGSENVTESHATPLPPKDPMPNNLKRSATSRTSDVERGSFSQPGSAKRQKINQAVINLDEDIMEFSSDTGMQREPQSSIPAFHPPKPTSSPSQATVPTPGGREKTTTTQPTPTNQPTALAAGSSLSSGRSSVATGVPSLSTADTVSATRDPFALAESHSITRVSYPQSESSKSTKNASLPTQQIASKASSPTNKTPNPRSASNVLPKNVKPVTNTPSSQRKGTNTDTSTARPETPRSGSGSYAPADTTKSSTGKSPAQPAKKTSIRKPPTAKSGPSSAAASLILTESTRTTANAPMPKPSHAAESISLSTTDTPVSGAAPSYSDKKSSKMRPSWAKPSSKKGRQPSAAKPASPSLPAERENIAPTKMSSAPPMQTSSQPPTAPLKVHLPVQQIHSMGTSAPPSRGENIIPTEMSSAPLGSPRVFPSPTTCTETHSPAEPIRSVTIPPPPSVVMECIVPKEMPLPPPSSAPLSPTVAPTVSRPPTAPVEAHRPTDKMHSVSISAPPAEITDFTSPNFEIKLPDLTPRASAPYSVSGAQLPIPEKENDVTAVVRFVQQPSTSQSSNRAGGPVLKFIVERSEGDMNVDSPISEEDFRADNLSDFFARVSSRCLNPSTFVPRLRFKQWWGAKVEFVVDRYTTIEAWRKVRSDIRRNVGSLSEKKPDKKKFEVYIYVEGAGGSSKDEDEDEDYW